MEIKCPKCSAPLLKSYGNTYKLRSRHVRWDNLSDTAVIQCNFCRSFSDIPLELKITNDKVVLEVGKDIKKSTPQKLIVTTETKKNDKTQK